MSRKRLLLIHTGGTVGMVPKGSPGPLTPSHYAENVLPFVRGLEDLVELSGVVLSNIDSCDITPDHWHSIAGVIAERVDEFDGFVVLHGTDTMAYTATALSFLLQNLPKPVILTGSQRPIAEVRTDARLNVVHSAICATLDIPEVGLYFGTDLLRGNRATKTSIQSYAAFSSPNFLPLVRMGVEIEPMALPWQPVGEFELRHGFSRDVEVLTIFPGQSARTIDRLVESGAKGLVLLGFGAGNLPLAGWSDAIQRATDAKVPVVLSSQCSYGHVTPGAYETSAGAIQAGALSAGDMTREAALVKLMFLLGQHLELNEIRNVWGRSLAGECTEQPS